MMMNIQVSTQSTDCQYDQVRQKAFKFHQELRAKHIQQYKARMRKQNNCLYQLNNLLNQLPKTMLGVLNWSREVVQHISKSRDYKFPYQKVIDLYKLIQKFPCLETIKILYIISHRISPMGIHQLFQYDIAGLLQKLITYPQKIIPKILLSNLNKLQSQAMYLEVARQSMLVLAALSQQSQKARNFLVINHKTFNCIKKAYQRIGQPIQNQFIVSVYSYTCHQLLHDEQFIKIIRACQFIFCQQLQNLQFKQIQLILKGLTNIVKSRQKWAMDLIEDSSQYDLLDKIHKVLKWCNETVKIQMQDQVRISVDEQERYKDIQKLKQLGQIVHQINLFLIFYIQISTNQYFNWEIYLQQFFIVLEIEGAFYQNARRDVYFIINNLICEAQQPDTSYHLLRSIVFQHNCINVFKQCLQKQINEDIVQQLSNCICSLLIFKDVENLAHEIKSSNLVKCCLEAITRDFYRPNDDTRSCLITGLINLIDKTKNQSIKQYYIYQIKCYENKLQYISTNWKKNQERSQLAIDRLLQQVSKYM